MSISFSSHCIYTKNMDIRVSKISNRVSKRHPDTPLAKGLVQGLCAHYVSLWQLQGLPVKLFNPLQSSFYIPISALYTPLLPHTPCNCQEIAQYQSNLVKTFLRCSCTTALLEDVTTALECTSCKALMHYIVQLHVSTGVLPVQKK